jgi:hypothetical protein
VDLQRRRHGLALTADASRAAAGSDRCIVTAADSRYGFWLLNLIGSVQNNSPGTARIVAYDLGLSTLQRRLLDAIRGIDVRTVPSFVPHWASGRSWKFWIWAHTEATEILWLDAGFTVLRDLRHVFEKIREESYFAVPHGAPNHRSTPSDWYRLYDLDPSFGERVGFTSGVFGFSRPSWVYDRVVAPAYQDAVEGRCLGFSAEEADLFNWGLDLMQAPLIRDCPRFRWDQSVFNVRFFQAVPAPRLDHVAHRYTAWRSNHEHPEQVLWNHRRRGNYRYLGQAHYAARYRLRAIAVQVRLSYPLYRWLLDPTIYRRKVVHALRRCRPLRSSFRGRRGTAPGREDSTTPRA